MHLGRAQRKIILFHARLQELLCTGATIQRGRVEKSGEGDPIFVLNCGPGNEVKLVKVKDIRKHCATVKPWSKTLEALDPVVTTLFPRGWKHSAPVSDPKKRIGVFTFARKIGFDRPRARYILDYEYARQLPTFSAVTMERSKANDFVSSFGGLYYLYRHDLNEQTNKRNQPQGVLVRSTVSIRYPVPYAPKRTDKGNITRVRCKINIPSYDGISADLHKYDGYVSRGGRHWWNWLLQLRPKIDQRSDTEDLVLMYTEAGNSRREEDAPTMGVMLTQNQEDKLAPTVSTIVLLRDSRYQVDYRKLDRCPPEKRGPDFPEYLSNYYSLVPKDERDFMRKLPKVIDLSKSSRWAHTDRIAVGALFDGWDKVNRIGLHP